MGLFVSIATEIPHGGAVDKGIRWDLLHFTGGLDVLFCPGEEGRPDH
jgi:hypothetical protein